MALDGDGAAEITLTVPAGLTTDSHALTLTMADGADDGDEPDVLGSIMVDVSGLSLILSPPSAVEGTVITASGSGYAEETPVGIASIITKTEGSEPATLNGVINSTGNLLATFTLPDLPPGEHTVQLTQAGGRVGEGTITVPEPTFTISPEEGKLGSAITVLR